MKNLKRIFLLIMILISSNTVDAYYSIRWHVKLSRHRDCHGFGLCVFATIEFDDEEDAYIRTTDNSAIVNAGFNEEGQLVLIFDKKTGMSPETYDACFSKGTFLCEDDFPIPEDALKKMNHLGHYTIKAGTYPVKISGDQITLVL